MRPRPTSRRITVSNDDAGIVSFRVNVPNRPTLGQDMLFEIWVDTDNNTATGSPDLGGADYVMQLVRGEISLYKWDGTDYTRRFGDPSAVTLNFAYQAGLTARISAAELGNTKAFKFFVVAISGLVVDPVTGEPGWRELQGGRRPGRRGRPLPVHRERRQADARRARRHDHARSPEGRQDVHDAHDRGAVGYGCRAPERPGHLHRARRDGTAARAARPRPGRRGRVHLADTRKREGKDVQRDRRPSSSRVCAHRGASRGRSRSSLLVRRLAPLACLALLVAFAGTASGALDPDPRSVIERAQSRSASG